MTVAAIRIGLADRLATIDGLRTSATVPDSPNPPHAFIGEPTGHYDDTFDGDWTITFPIFLLVTRAAGSARAQDLHDPYLDPTGDKSIAAAIYGDSRLAGAAQDTRLIGFDNYGGNYGFGDPEVVFVGVTFNVEVMA